MWFYTFTVGYHELSGSKIPLKKPLLVLKKKITKSDMEIDQNDDSLNSSRVELEVTGIIRHRILFKTRPKALISGKMQPFVKFCSTFSSMIEAHTIVSYFLC
ncbi:putative chromosome transmission fidelity protein [Helianthus annuus]|nr:putative chromosome transmission fidelity protein [Helianthus annuus]